MKTERFQTDGLWIEWQLDRWNGEGFIAWKPSVSQCFTDRKALLRFAAWPASTPTGAALRQWLEGLKPREQVAEAADLQAITWGPEGHSPEEHSPKEHSPKGHSPEEPEPNDNTRTIT